MRRKQNSPPRDSINVLATFLDVSRWLGQLFYLSVDAKANAAKRRNKKDDKRVAASNTGRFHAESQKKKIGREGGSRRRA